MARDRDPIDASDAHNARGIELADRGWLDEALKEFRKAIELDPESAHAHDNLATVHAEKKEWKEALRGYLRALELEPDGATAHFNLAHFLATHALDAAVAEYREAIALDPDHPDSHLNLGLALADQGEEAAARAEMEVAARLAPKDPFIRHELAALLMDQGDYRTAIGHLKEVARAEPDRFEAHLDLGICYAQKGFYAEAERAYARARELRAGDLLLDYNAAALYALWGRDEEALRWMAAALATDGARVRDWLRDDPSFARLAGTAPWRALLHG